ncbi:hypothetical protein KSP40_PGU004277 [Platanthera guangdongensis]|uniref:Uncharacterized protein n=1 Tax=Platanthera guangdongensis TaxID=2320717 RepID=A0ABR2LY97_9ASPA
MCLALLGCQGSTTSTPLTCSSSSGSSSQDLRSIAFYILLETCMGSRSIPTPQTTSLGTTAQHQKSRPPPQTARPPLSSEYQLGETATNRAVSFPL